MAAVPPTPHARANAWKDVTVEELKDFFGLFFLTGLIKKTELAEYWSTDEVLSTPYFAKVMSRNRFQLILRFLHYTDRPQDSDDRIFRVRPILEYLVRKWQEMFQPGKHISVDEGTLLWRGRLSFRVYNPAKPVR